MSEQFEHPFQLYEKASLHQVIRSYQENLEWNVIKVITKEPYSIQDFVKKGTQGGAHYTVEKVLLPEKNGRIFLAYAHDVAQDFEDRIRKLLQNKTLLKDEKVKALSICYGLALDAEEKYNLENLFSFAWNFQWMIKGKDHHFHHIPFASLELKHIGETISEELMIRHHFFQWMRRKIAAAMNVLQTIELHDPLMTWKDKKAKIKLVELMYALQKSGEIKFIGDREKKVFESYLEKLFSTGQINWRNMESDIRKRKDKEGKTKWAFLEALIKADIYNVD